MQKSIIISANSEQTCMALCEDGILVEYIMEGTYSQSIVGCIFKGQVKQIKRGIQAAFIDIGRDKNAFMYLEAESKLTEGEHILVQVVKDANADKGAVVNQSISIAGRYVVLMPTVSYIGVSKNISDKEKRQVLEHIAEKYRTNEYGVILRTACLEASEEEIGADIVQLIKQWQAICAKFKIMNTGSLLYRELDLPIRVIRDYLQMDISEIVVDNQDLHRIINELITDTSPHMLPKLKLHEHRIDVFEYFGLNKDIDGILNRRVELANGSYLIFDYTEALTVIDVNSGKFVGKNLSGDGYLQTNLQATAEIVRQIRLRDITGIIIIDFIDMQKEKDREQVTGLLKELFARDKRKPKVVGFTELGLMQITRKKVRKNTFNSLMSDCTYCNGSGKLKSLESVSLDIYRSLTALSKRKLPQRTVSLHAHSLLIQHFAKKYLVNIQHTLNLKIKLKSVDSMHRELFSILLDKDDSD